VVGASGTLPIGKRATELMMRQRHLLEQEGVVFLANGRVDMSRHQWRQSVSGDVGGLFEDP
jgi:alkylated DNA nucleotide flippase Atl1